MIKIQVDLHPYGNASETKKLSTIEIINVGGTKSVGYYTVIVDGRELGQEVTHKRGLGVLVLLEVALHLWNEENI